jgi:hypothetical protein
MPPAPRPPGDTKPASTIGAKPIETLTSPLPGDMPESDDVPMPPKIQEQDPATAPKAIMWTVADANARQRDAKGIPIPRMHDMGLDDGPIALYGPDRPKPLPVHVAMRFLIDPAFIVRNEKGERVNPVSVAVKRPSDGAVLLQPGQVVARFDEMSDDALRARCAVLPGADPSFVTWASREQMLSALAQHDLEQRRVPTGNDDASTLQAAPGGANAPVTQSWLDRVMPKPAAA